MGGRCDVHVFRPSPRLVARIQLSTLSLILAAYAWMAATARAQTPEAEDAGTAVAPADASTPSETNVEEESMSAAAPDDAEAPEMAARGEPDAGGGFEAAEVPGAAQSVLTELTRLRARIHHVAQIEHHLAAINALGERVQRLRIDSNLDALDVQPRRELLSLKELWTELDAQLSESSDALEESSTGLQGEADAIDAHRARWARTAAIGASREYPDALRSQVATVLDALDEAAGELEATLERVLAAQTRIAAHAIASGDVLTELERALEESRARVSARTHTAVFGGMVNRAPEPLLDQLRTSLVHQAHSLDRFARTAGARAYLHALLILSLLAFLFWVRREHRLPEDGGPGTRALSHPIALTALIGLMAVRPLYPFAPRAVVELSQVAAIGALLALRTSPLAGYVTRLVVTLYALEWLRLLLDEHHAEHRFALQLIALLGTLSYAYLAFRSRGIARSAWGTAGIACLVGLGACLAGYVPLGVLLVEGTIATAFAALLLLSVHWAWMGVTKAALTTEAAGSMVLGRHAGQTRAAARRASKLVLGFGFVWIALDYYRLRRPVADQTRRALAESVAFGEVNVSLGDVLAFGVGIWAAIIASRVLSTALEEDVAPRLNLGPGVPAAAALIVRYTVLALGFLLAAAAAGIGLSQLTLFAGALGVGVGFGLQNVVSNFVSGLLLVFERPVKVGDTVDIAGLRGTIKAIGIRSSTVRSWTGADVIIPNAKLIDSELINWTHADRSMRVDVSVGVAYGSDLRRVHGLLLDAARSVDAVLDYPAPAALMVGFGDSAIDFRVQVWIANPPDQPRVQSKLGLAIDEALGAAGVEIPFPQRDLHIRSDATRPDEGKLSAKVDAK